jgi:hypothetical protein
MEVTIRPSLGNLTCNLLFWLLIAIQYEERNGFRSMKQASRDVTDYCAALVP